MPRIPTYDRSENVAGRPQPFSTGDGYAAPGRAMQQLGQGIASLGSGLEASLKVAQGEKDEEDRFKTAMELTKFQAQQDQYHQDFLTKITGDGSDAERSRTAGFDTAWAEFSGRVAPSSPKLRRWFQLQGAQMRARYGTTAAAYGIRQRETHWLGETEKGIVGGVLPRVTDDIATVEGSLGLADTIIGQAPHLSEGSRAKVRDAAARMIMERWKEKAFEKAKADGSVDPAKVVEDLMKKYSDKFGMPQGKPQQPGAPSVEPAPSAERPTTGSYTMPPSARGDKRIPASLRYNNPGAQWPGPSARKFGSVGYVTLNDGQGNKIAIFDTFEQGAAAQFDLLYRKYAGKPLTRLLTIWSGGNHSAAYTRSVAGEMGIRPDAIITREMLKDPKIAVPLARAMARVESGRNHPAPISAWQAAHRMALGGPQPTTAAAPVPTAEAPPVGDQPAQPYGPDSELGPSSPGETGDVPAVMMDGTPTMAPAQPVQAAAPPQWLTQQPRTTTDYFMRRLYHESPQIGRQSQVIREKFQRLQTARTMVADVLAGRTPFNQHSDEQRKTMDWFFGQTKIPEKIMAGDAPTLASMVGLSQMINGVPKPVGEAFRGLYHSTDPKKRDLALTTIGAIVERAPNAFSEVQGGDEMVKTAIKFTTLKKYRSMSGEDAVKYLEMLKSPEYQKARKLMEGDPAFRAEVKKRTADEVARGIAEIGWTRFLPGGPSTPTITPSMGGLPPGMGSPALLAQAQDIYRENLLSMGVDNKDAAWATTLRELRQMHFGTSSLTGKPVLMRFAPETVFPAMGSVPKVVEFVQEDLKESVKKATGQDIPITDIYLATDPRTMREYTTMKSGGKISWLVTYKDKTGTFRSLDARWFIDPKAIHDRILRERVVTAPPGRSPFPYDPVTPEEEAQGGPLPSRTLAPNLERRLPQKRDKGPPQPTRPVIR